MQKKSIDIEEMMRLARLAMKNAYAPYSNFPVGCCIRTQEGHFFSGTNVENGAYAATQCAETSALGAMITQGERKITDIVTMGKEGVFCPPCGNCRQKLSEFVTEDARVHVCTPSKVIESIAFSDLLPYRFRLEPEASK